MRLFGIEFKRAKDEEIQQLPALAPPENDDGAVVSAPGGAYGTQADLYGAIKSEAELIMRYRNMSFQPEVDMAITETVNEMVSIDGEKKCVEINLDFLEDYSDKIKKEISKEFDTVVELLKFERDAYNIIRRWYIDGSLRYQVMVNPSKLEEGIKELRFLDSRRMRKIREYKDQKSMNNAAPTQKVVGPMPYKEYYLYVPSLPGVVQNQPYQNIQNQGIPIAKDSIIETTSGITDSQGQLILSYLHMGMKAASQLRMLEDATIIYRLSRAPERRVWYIDVGNLPRMKAEQYVRDIMVKHKNKLIYNPETGSIVDNRKFMTMLEDYWLPRREGGKGTEVSTLPPGQSLNQLDEVEYFQRLLYMSLHVPINRLSKDDIFGLGKPSEITRDEIKFAKFIARLRTRFSDLFLGALEKQLVLKKVITADEWIDMKYKIRFIFNKDNHFSELKDQEVRAARHDVLDRVAPYVGRYYSNKWVLQNILKQTEEEMIQMREEIEEEMLDHIFAQPIPGMEPEIIDEPEEEEPGIGTEPGAPNDNHDWLRQAKTTYDLLKQKKKKTPDELSQFRSAAQILGKNDGTPKKSRKTAIKGKPKNKDKK